MGEVRALDEVAERLGELAPVRDERRRVRGSAGGEPDERSYGGSNALDRTRTSLHLLDVDAGGQVVRHAGPLRCGGQPDAPTLPPRVVRNKDRPGTRWGRRVARRGDRGCPDGCPSAAGRVRLATGRSRG